MMVGQRPFRQPSPLFLASANVCRPLADAGKRPGTKSLLVLFFRKEHTSLKCLFFLNSKGAALHAPHPQEEEISLLVSSGFSQ